MLKAGVLAEPILVGRERELEELIRCLNSVFDGKGTTLFLTGEAGTGKTMMARKLLDMVKGKDVNVLSGWCLSDFAVPYLPFREAFNAYFKAKKTEEQESTGNEEEIKMWLAGPSQSERFQNLTPQGWQDLAVAAITKTLIAISEKKTTILFIDDLHWADSASLSLLHYIARSIGAARIFVLATYRSEELGPDLEGHAHPFLETLRMMRRENVLKEIKLSSLPPDHVIALAEKMVGGGLHRDLLDRLLEDSQGNPLFVVESLRMLSERGSLVHEDGRWGLSTDKIGIPAKIKDIVLRRVEMLKPNQQRMLQVASVIGDKFDVELLSVVLGQGFLNVLEALNAITQMSSLLFSEGSYYKFNHAMFREAIYNSVSMPLRKGYHAKVAEKLEAINIDSVVSPFNDLAYHYEQAGNKEKAVKYALAAGEYALVRFSNTEAEKHYRFVLSAVSESSEHLAERTAALEGLGDSLNAVGLFNEAMKEFEQLSSITVSGALKLRALRKAFLCSYWRGDWIHAHELAYKAEGYAQFDRLEFARLRLYRGFMAGRELKAKEAVEDVVWALRVFEEEFSLCDVAAALAEIVFINDWNVPIELRLAAALRSVAIFQELEDLRGQVLAFNRLAGVFRRGGLFKEGEESGDEALRIGEGVGEYNFMALTLFGKTINLLMNREVRKALAVSLKAVEYAERTNAYYTQNICYQNLIIIYARLGEIEHAKEYAKKADRLLNRLGSVDGVVKPADMALINWANIFFAEGRWREATELFEQVDDVWLNKTVPFFIIGLKKMYADALEKQGRIEEARVQLEDVKNLIKIVEEAIETDKLPNRLEHAEINPYFMAQREIGVGQELSVRLDLVNVGKNYAKLIKVESLIPPGFKVNELPSSYKVHDGSIAIDGIELGPFSVKTIKLSIQAKNAGTFTLSPEVIYIDDLGKTNMCKPQPITVTVRPMLHAKIGEETVSVPVLPGRVTTGFEDLDVLLLGGIPENYAVVLSGSPSDERAYLIKNFLEAGIKDNEIVFYVTSTETEDLLNYLKNPNFYLFLCNPKPIFEIPDLPNVYKLRSKTDLTNLSISLAKAYRNVDQSKSKRICVQTVSDVLVDYNTKATRKWISEMITDLSTKGFTMLAVMDPRMHPSDQANAIINLFDGEISIIQSSDPFDCKKSILVKKLKNQEYIKKPICLTK